MFFGIKYYGLAVLLAVCPRALCSDFSNPVVSTNLTSLVQASSLSMAQNGGPGTFSVTTTGTNHLSGATLFNSSNFGSKFPIYGGGYAPSSSAILPVPQQSLNVNALVVNTNNTPLPVNIINTNTNTFATNPTTFKQNYIKGPKYPPHFRCWS